MIFFIMSEKPDHPHVMLYFSFFLQKGQIAEMKWQRRAMYV